jgi:hypothetical protein
LARRFGATSVSDVGGGNWRAFTGLPEQPPVHPQHERRKYLVRAADALTPPLLLKFAGYGRYGAAAITRARAAADAGWAPPVNAAGEGWVEHPWLTATGSAWHTEDSDITRLADYLTFVAQTRRCGQATAPAALREMAVTNMRAGDGEDAARAIERVPLPEVVEAVHTDNRLQRHEWIRINGRLLKTDGVDHGDDHFFPGPTDIAWDVAGVIEEWRLNDAACSALLTRFRTVGGDQTIGDRLPFYRVAYLAFRSGYSRFAAEQLSSTDDGRRFRQAHARYRARLEEVIACAC